MRIFLLSFALAASLFAAPQPSVPVRPVRQKLAKPHAPKNRKNKVKGRKAIKPHRRSN